MVRTFLPHTSVATIGFASRTSVLLSVLSVLRYIGKQTFHKVCFLFFLTEYRRGCPRREGDKPMKLMEQKIRKEGVVLPGGVLKVGSFLNQQLDIPFLHEAGREIARLFRDAGVTKVITIEASGIPLATLTALELGVPAVIVKKHASANQSPDVYSAEIASFTHKNTYTAVVAKEYIKPTDSILIVDDFLAVGNAIRGLRQILADAGVTLAGCAIAVEKAFQHGGDDLRAEGIRVESLAIVEDMKDGTVTFRP